MAITAADEKACVTGFLSAIAEARAVWTLRFHDPLHVFSIGRVGEQSREAAVALRPKDIDGELHAVAHLDATIAFLLDHVLRLRNFCVPILICHVACAP